MSEAQNGTVTLTTKLRSEDLKEEPAGDTTMKSDCTTYYQLSKAQIIRGDSDTTDVTDVLEK